jgi:hypothetical protein
LRVLITADFHGASNAENKLTKLLERGYDCAILIGDLTDFGPADVAESLLERVREFGIPTLSIPGNCDPKEILEVLDRYEVNLHGRCREIGNIAFVGLGGSNITPFKTPFELTEAEIREELATIARGTSDRWILVTHAPPYNTGLDELESGSHVGSKSIRQYVEERQPMALVCGHVHEARTVERLGRTVMVNPGPMPKGYAAELRIAGKRRVEAELIEV